jgi:hypothetical protein
VTAAAVSVGRHTQDSISVWQPPNPRLSLFLNVHPNDDHDPSNHPVEILITIHNACM